MGLLVFLLLGIGTGLTCWWWLPERDEMSRRAAFATVAVGMTGALLGGILGSAVWGDGVLFAVSPLVVGPSALISLVFLGLLVVQGRRLSADSNEQVHGDIG